MRDDAFTEMRIAMHIENLYTLPIETVIGSYIGLMIALENSPEISLELMNRLHSAGLSTAPLYKRLLEKRAESQS